MKTMEKNMKKMMIHIKILSLIWMNTGMMIVTTTTMMMTHHRLRSLLPTPAMMMRAVMMMTPTTLTAHARSLICLLALGLRVSTLHQLLLPRQWWKININFREEQLLQKH